MAKFYIFTADHSGLPIATRLQDEGDRATLVAIRPEERNGKTELPKTPDEAKKNKQRIEYLGKNGNGLIPKMWASEAMGRINPGDLVLFDQIYGWQYGHQLRKKGVRVRGGTKNGFFLETERRETLALLKHLGFDIPEQVHFGPGSSKRGIEFLKSVKDNTLYVFKSDDPKIVTQVADFENDELIQKLTAEAKEIDTDGFLLQQKVEGIEAAVETYYYNGEPLFANVDIEAKKKYNEMSEVQTGCSMNILFMLPVDHPLRERVNGALDAVAKRYFSGSCILDLSFIYEPIEDKLYALEMCGERNAYNAVFPMLNLLTVPIGEFYAKLLRGEYKGDVTEKLFQEGFAASLRVFNEDKTPDQRVLFPDEYKPHYWIWDVHKKGKELLTTGDESLGVITATGENPESALAKVREMFYKLHMPTKWARDDFDNDDYPTLPLSRYHELKRLGMF